MVILELTRDVLDSAQDMSEKHHRARNNPYDEAKFPIRSPSRLKLHPVSLDDLILDKRSGIYLIWEKKGNSAYVGMTADFSYRFFHGKPDHKQNCVNCTCHGHINATPVTCTSHHVINSKNGFHVSILETMKYEPMSVCQAEVDWYYILKAQGLNMVNRDWALGNPHFSGIPIVSCNLKTEEYSFSPNQIGAAVHCYGKTTGGAGYVDVCAKKRQNQQSGFTHRIATEKEMEIYKTTRNITELIQGLTREVSWSRRTARELEVDLSEACPGCRDDTQSHPKRTFVLDWGDGPLSKLDLEHLRQTMQGKYEKSDVKTTLNGISWLKSRTDKKYVPRWQVRARRSSTDSKDLFQTSRKQWSEENLLDAAIYRENKIRESGWIDHNKGNYGSNAEWINIQLGVTIYVDWDLTNQSGD